MNLEKELKQLENIAKKLESDELPLDEAITLFEKGIDLATSIRTALSEAKIRIETVVESARDSFTIEPLDVEQNPPSGAALGNASRGQRHFTLADTWQCQSLTFPRRGSSLDEKTPLAHKPPYRTRRRAARDTSIALDQRVSLAHNRTYGCSKRSDRHSSHRCRSGWINGGHLRWKILAVYGCS